MNDRDEPACAPQSSVAPVPEVDAVVRDASETLKHFARRLFACNPFYLVSAALLLYGFHRVSADASFLRAELHQLVFNFASLQFYELLLVATAIFLARRAIWYDSTLLAGLENLFVFVPFILITQGALIDRHYVWLMCGAGGLMVVLRWSALKRLLTELNFNNRVLGLGLLLLALNVALPIIYRSLHESNRFGSNPEAGLQFETAKYTWLLILPAAFAFGNFLPCAKEKGGLLPQRRWLPFAFYALWVSATALHVCSLDYVYNLHVPIAWLAPALWALAWTLGRRLPELLTQQLRPVNNVLRVIPVLVPLLAVSGSGGQIYLALTALNAAIFAIACIVQPGQRLARHLLFVSVFMIVAGLPGGWLPASVPQLNREEFIVLGVLGYLLFWIALSPNPRLAVVGSLAVLAAVVKLFDGSNAAWQWAWQGALAFLLLHSLRWDDAREPGARLTRLVAAMVWVGHAFGWMRVENGLWAACIPGGLVLAVCIAVRLTQGEWRHRVVAGAAALVTVSGPAHSLINSAHAVPGALLIVMGSFVCFGFGTVAALTKHRWLGEGRS